MTPCKKAPSRRIPLPQRTARPTSGQRHERSEHVSAFRFYSGVMPAMLIAKFVGDVDELKAVYDREHALIMERGGPFPSVSSATTAPRVRMRSTSSASGNRPTT